MYQRGQAFVRAMKPDGTFHDKVDVMDLDKPSLDAWMILAICEVARSIDKGWHPLTSYELGDGDDRFYEIDPNAVYRYVAVLGA